MDHGSYSLRPLLHPTPSTHLSVAQAVTLHKTNDDMEWQRQLESATSRMRTSALEGYAATTVSIRGPEIQLTPALWP